MQYSGMRASAPPAVKQATDPGEGIDHYKKLFSFTQRKVEFENFRFKHPAMLAVVIESINT